MMISGKSKPNFWSRLLFSMIAIFALPNAQSLESQSNAENYSSGISIQQVLETAKVAREVQRQTLQQPALPHQIEKHVEIQPHFVADVLNACAPIRAGPALI